MSALRQIILENKELVASLTDAELQGALTRAHLEANVSGDDTRCIVGILAFERLATETEHRKKLVMV